MSIAWTRVASTRYARTLLVYKQRGVQPLAFNAQVEIHTQIRTSALGHWCVEHYKDDLAFVVMDLEAGHHAWLDCFSSTLASGIWVYAAADGAVGRSACFPPRPYQDALVQGRMKTRRIGMDVTVNGHLGSLSFMRVYPLFSCSYKMPGGGTRVAQTERPSRLSRGA
jgi:hypothetical protein